MKKFDRGDIKFILASASPRRRQLLSEAGYDFEVIVSNVDEGRFDDQRDKLSAAEFAALLARTKALDVAGRFTNRLAVGADTVADFDGEIIGKARDSEHARRIVSMLFSRPHKIITAIAMIKLDENIELVDSATTMIYPVRLTDEQISRHIESGVWKDKAGAYSIKDGGDEFVERIEGSQSNVSGLGMELFEKMMGNVLKRLCCD